MKKKLLPIVLGIAMSGALLGGCGGGSATSETTAGTTAQANKQPDTTTAANTGTDQEKREITIYTYYAESAKLAIDGALVEMQKLYPDIIFNIEHRSDADGSVLRTRAAVGELPDIMELTGALTETFVTSKDILMLDDNMNKMGFLDKFIPNVLEGSKYGDGHYYAIGPDVPENYMIFYNKSVFNELNLSAPTNFEEFKEVVTTLKGAGKIPLALFGAEQWPGLQLYDLAVLGSGNTNGIGALEADTTASADAAYITAAEKVLELVNLGLIGDGVFNTNSAQAMEMVKLGQAGMYSCGSWYLGDCAEYGDEIDFFDYNPFCDTGSEEALRWYKSGGAPSAGGYGVSAKTEDPDLVQEIALSFVIEKARANTKVNSVVNLLNEEVQPDVPRSESYERYANDVTGYKNMSKYGWALTNPELYIVLQDTTEKLLAGSMTPADYIAELDKKISEIE